MNLRLSNLQTKTGLDRLLALLAGDRIAAQKGADRTPLEAVINTVVDGVLMIDEHGRIQMFNPAAEKLFGFQADEIVGQNVSCLMPEPYRHEHDGYLAHYHATGERKIIGMIRELEAQHRDGTVFPMELSVSELRVGNDRTFVGVIRDIRERKHHEEELAAAMAELARSNKELEQFAYVASHDLQEPLRMVASFTGLLADKYGDQLDVQASEYMTYAVDGAKRMQALLNGLLEYSRVGTRGAEIRPVDSKSIVDEALANLQLLIYENNASVDVGELPVVRADREQMVRVFQNLIANAVKFRRKDVPPNIRISAERVNFRWRFSVGDNGIGIDPQYADRVFSIFQRLHKRGEYPGEGIGLAVAKRIIERHGGAIWLESVPGQGSEFYFTLPPADRAQRKNFLESDKS